MLLITIFVSCLSPIYANTATQKYSKTEILSELNKISQYTSIEVSNKISKANIDHTIFNQEQLVNLIKESLNVINPSITEEKNRQTLNETQEYLINKLKSYNITGVSFAIDPNLAFILDTQNPIFNVTYKDPDGNTKQIQYQARINSIGLKLEASIKFDMILFTNTSANFYDSNKEIELGLGIDINIMKNKLIPFNIGFTYAPFVNTPGGMIIISITFLFAPPSLSIVTGGTLTPIATN